MAYTGALAHTPDNTTFRGGGPKDINDLDQWRWGPDSVPRHFDILNAYAAAYVADDQLNVFMGQNRLDTNGGGELGFWLFQQDIGLNADGTFRGTHTAGDVLIQVSFTHGNNVGTVTVYQWDPTATDNLRLLPSADDVYAVTNSSPIDAAWGTGVPANSFFEAGINLTSILNQTSEPDVDFKSFLAESRSSASVHSTLQDFELGPIQFSTGPAIEIVKSVNGDHANAAPDPSVLAGTDVTFTYAVTNTGARALSGLQVTDDNGTPGYAGDDFSPQYVSGDDGNGVLDPGETWVYRTSRPAVAGPQASLATASGTDSRGRTLTETGAAHYFGAAPAIHVDEEVSIDGDGTWVSADSGTGPTLLASGAAPRFKFVVSNTGNVALANVALTDALFGTLAVPGALAVGASAEVVRTGSWRAGQQADVATASGDFTDDAGNTRRCSDSDAAHYFGASPAVGVKEEASAGCGGTGPVLPQSGQAPPFKFGVTNPGNVALSNVAPQTESLTLAVAALVGPGAPVPSPLGTSPAAPGPSRPPPLGGLVAQPVTAASLLAAADGQRAGQFLVGGGGGGGASPEAEALPTALAGRGRETVLPMQPAADTSPGAAFVPEGETYRPLGERLPSDGKGAGENASALLSHGVADKALRLASSLADADDSVALVEAITGPEAVSAAGPPPAPPPRTAERSLETVPSSTGAAGPTPGPGREEKVVPAGARHWNWLAGAAVLTALLLVARCGWRGRRRPTGHRPVRGSRGGGPVSSLSEHEVKHVRPQ